MIMISYVAFHDLHLYEEYREIIPEIMCTKVPDGDFQSLVDNFPNKLARVIPWGSRRRGAV